MRDAKPGNKRSARRFLYATIAILCVASLLFIWRLSQPILDGPLVCADCGTVWADTVKKGEMHVQVRGKGTIMLVRRKAVSAVIEIPETQACDVKRNQTAEVDTPAGIVPGHISAIEGAPENGVRRVVLTLDRAVPGGVTNGAQVDATITIETLRNVVYVGRPVHGEPNSSDTIFRVTPDGHDVYRVKVKFGRASVNAIQILSGLNPGDKVILSDMSQWDAVDHIEIR